MLKYVFGKVVGLPVKGVKERKIWSVIGNVWHILTNNFYKTDEINDSTFGNMFYGMCRQEII